MLKNHIKEKKNLQTLKNKIYLLCKIMFLSSEWYVLIVHKGYE